MFVAGFTTCNVSQTHNYLTALNASKGAIQVFSVNNTPLKTILILSVILGLSFLSKKPPPQSVLTWRIKIVPFSLVLISFLRDQFCIYSSEIWSKGCFPASLKVLTILGGRSCYKKIFQMQKDWRMWQVLQFSHSVPVQYWTRVGIIMDSSTFRSRVREVNCHFPVLIPSLPSFSASLNTCLFCSSPNFLEASLFLMPLQARATDVSCLFLEDKRALG